MTGPHRRPSAGAQTVHLARRFFGALSPAGPPAADEAWVSGVLGAGSGAHRLWMSMSGPDRRHAVGVARRVDQAVDGPEPALLAAALLHDVGKVTSGLGTMARVPATLVGAAGGRRRAAAWSARPGARGRLGRYLRHDEEGAALLRDAGAPVLAVTWAREHHLPPDRWTVPAETGRILKEADDD